MVSAGEQRAAFQQQEGWIEWKEIHIGKIAGPLPKRNEGSHYFAARDTDAWSLNSERENEKLLFYRGIADVGVDLKAVVSKDGVSIRNDGSEIFLRQSYLRIARAASATTSFAV